MLAKREFARFEQFLFLSQFFQMSSAAKTSASVYMWKSVKISGLGIVPLTTSYIRFGLVFSHLLVQLAFVPIDLIIGD